MLSVHWSCLMETLIIPGILLFKIISPSLLLMSSLALLFVVANLLQKNNKSMVLISAQRRHMNTISKTWIISVNLPDMVVNARCINSTREKFPTKASVLRFVLSPSIASRKDQISNVNLFYRSPAVMVHLLQERRDLSISSPHVSHPAFWRNFSVLVIRYFTMSVYKDIVCSIWRLIVQELCESRGGRPHEPSGFRGRKATLNHASALVVSTCP